MTIFGCFIITVNDLTNTFDFSESKQSFWGVFVLVVIVLVIFVLWSVNQNFTVSTVVIVVLIHLLSLIAIFILLSSSYADAYTNVFHFF